MEYDPRTLLQELDDAREQNRSIGATLPERVTALHGWDFMTTRQSGTRDPRNTYYQWTTYFLSLVAAGVPRWRETTTLDEWAEDVEAHQMAMDRLSMDTRLRHTISRLGVDFAISDAARGVVVRSRNKRADRLLKRAGERGKARGEDVSGMQSDAYWPRLRRLESDQLVWDPTRIEEEDWRWTAHLEVRDLSELERENRYEGAKWDLDALRASVWRAGERTIGGGSSLREESKYARTDIVAYWVMHARFAETRDVPGADDEHTPDNGYNGALFYLPHVEPSGTGSKFVRPPQMYYGPEDGPHVVIGSMPMPGTSFRCPPLVANAETVRARAAYERAVNRSGERYKRIIAVARGKDELAEILVDAQHDGIVAFGRTADDIRKEVMPVELWGTTPQQMEHLLFLRDTEDQAIGLSEEARGRASDKTATAASLANDATSRRMSYPVADFVDGMNRAGRKLGWFVWHDESFVADVGESIYVGGQMPGDSIGYDDVDMGVEFTSISHMSEAKRDRQFQRTVELFPVLQGLPSIAGHTQTDEYMEMVEQFGELPGAERLVNPEGLAQAAAVFMQGQVNAAQPTPEKRPAGKGKPAASGPPTYESMARPAGNGFAGTLPGQQGGKNGAVAE